MKGNKGILLPVFFFLKKKKKKKKKRSDWANVAQSEEEKGSLLLPLIRPPEREHSSLVFTAASAVFSGDSPRDLL